MMQMNKKIKEIVAAIALGLSLYTTNYIQPQIPANVQQQSSALEQIVKNANTKFQNNLNSYKYKVLGRDYDSPYIKNLREYMQRHVESKEDTSSRVPLKWLNILPESQMGGVLGFTYLGDHSMGRRADLTGSMARMVDIHESIHTPDEYETRVLTDWIMDKTRSRYIG